LVSDKLKDSGFNGFTLVIETNCILTVCKPAGFAIISLTILRIICKVTKTTFQKLPWKLDDSR